MLRVASAGRPSSAVVPTFASPVAVVAVVMMVSAGVRTWVVVSLVSVAAAAVVVVAVGAQGHRLTIAGTREVHASQPRLVTFETASRAHSGPGVLH